MDEGVKVNAIVDKQLRKRVFAAWVSKTDSDYLFMHEFDTMVYEKGLMVLDKEMDKRGG